MKDEVSIKHTADIKELGIFVRKSVIVKVESDFLIMLLNHLTSQYFFNKSTYYVDADMEFVYRKNFHAAEFKKTVDWYAVCIDLHNRIVVFNENEFLKHYQTPQYSVVVTSDDITLVDAKLNQFIEKRPVIFLFSQRDIKNCLHIYAKRIELWLHEKSYIIERSIIDMMYAEGENFNPTQDEKSDVFIHTEVRHQLYADKDTFVTDLLHSDLGLICDIQDRLIEELSYVPMPIEG